MTINSHDFRHAMSMFTTGICVITTHSAHQPPVGLTVNSLASVSLDPTLILWSLGCYSECRAVFDTVDHFAVNVLSVKQRDLCQRYANKDTHILLDEHYQLSNAGNPILHGTLSSLECKVWARHPGGDHVIIMGEVMSAQTHHEDQPLVFHASQYGTVKVPKGPVA